MPQVQRQFPVNGVQPSRPVGCIVAQREVLQVTGSPSRDRHAKEDDPEHKRSALNLDAVLNYCGIPNEPEPHNALTGAKSHAEVISRLLYDKKLLPEFEQYHIPWQS